MDTNPNRTQQLLNVARRLLQPAESQELQAKPDKKPMPQEPIVTPGTRG